MNTTFEPGILSPSSQYLQDGGNQQPSMGTPRPGTPRGSYFRLSPDGNLNPGTPGAASHDHHNKYPNSPWSGSEPATPGSGYNRNSVVPNSPYISSYPNTPATPGGGGFYQKPVNGIGSTMPPSNGNAVVPPGSPWTDRSVCTPGPMTPLTPATPIPTMSDHGNGTSNGFGSGNGSPTFHLENMNSHNNNHNNNNNNNAKALQQVPHQSPPHSSSTLAGLLQDGVDPLLPVPVMNHSLQNASSILPPPPNPNHIDNGGSLDDLSPTIPLLSDKEISQVVENNPNLISEFEQFFEDFMNTRKNEENNLNQQSQLQQPQIQQQQQPQQQLQQQQQQQQQPPPLQMQQQPSQPPQLMNQMGMGNNGHPMMYNDNSLAQGGQPGLIMNNNGHLMQLGNGSVGPMRQNKFMSQNHHGQHPYIMQNNNGNIMMRGRPHPGHPMQYGQQQPQQNLQHLHQNMGNGMNMMASGRPQQAQFALQGHANPSASSVYAHPPSGNNGGYVQVRQQPMQHNMGNPTYNNVQQNQNSAPVHYAPQQQMSNLNSPLGMMGNPNNGAVMPNNRGIPQQPNSYFQTPVNPVNGGVEQGLSNGTSVLPSTTYPFDLNSGGGGIGSMNAMNPGTSAIQGTQVPVQNSANIGVAPPSQPTNNNPSIPIADLDLEGSYDGSSISQTTWNKAAEKANSRSNPVAEVGKVLFDEIFSDDEVIQCTLSGRGSTEKFNPNKVMFLKRAVAWLLNRPPRPCEFNVNTCDYALTPEDESGVKGLDKKVFTEYRSRRRGDILKGRNQSNS